MARAGLAARGVVYIVLAFLAADIAARGGSPAPTSGEGAVQEVGRQPAGPLLLTVLAAGFACYSAWRLVQAVTGRDKPGKPGNGWVRIGWLAICALYASLCVRAIGFLASSSNGSSSGGQSKSRAWAATVMGWPGGRVLLFIGGLAILGGGVALGVWGIAHDYEKQLRLEGRTPLIRTLPRILGAAGDVARGGVAVLVAAYLLRAAVDGRASAVKTADQALLTFTHNGYGVALIAVIAAGLLSFAAYSFFETWLRKL